MSRGKKRRRAAKPASTPHVSGESMGGFGDLRWTNNSEMMATKKVVMEADAVVPVTPGRVMETTAGFPDYPSDSSDLPTLSREFLGNSGLGTLRGSTTLKAKRKPTPTPSIDVKATFRPQLTDPFTGSGYGEITEATTPSDQEDFDILREAIKIYRANEQTVVFAIAVDKENPEANNPIAIQCYGGTPFGGYVHDCTSDAYLIGCVECLQIGSVPFSFLIMIPNVGVWKMKVPIPEPVLLRAFTPSQREMLEKYQAKYPKARFDIQFIQMLGCH